MTSFILWKLALSFIFVANYSKHNTKLSLCWLFYWRWKYVHESRISQILSADSIWDWAIYTLWGGLQSYFFGNLFLHQVLLEKSPFCFYFKAKQTRLCYSGNFDSFSTGTFGGSYTWWNVVSSRELATTLWPILENYCLKILTWILPLEAIALI